ncbi:MAG: hypothetical protein JW976_02605 [Syntrophaceae bacterium]|nr:hypothetical protein [Syntrophaceae bacterium]
MIRIAVEVKVQNHEEILKDRDGFFPTLFAKIVTGDMEVKVEEEIGKDLVEKLLPTVKKILQSQKVKAKAIVYVEKREE